MALRAGVVTFPGSNCDRDVAVALMAAGAQVNRLWHGETDLPALDLIVLPGGFAHGDYLRCGAIAAQAPVMAEVVARAEAGVAVLGICNGFQVLVEAGLLPGALISNAGLRFVCREVALEVGTTASPFTCAYAGMAAIRLPVAHHDGNYVLPEDETRRLEDEDRIVFRYQEPVNGSSAAIAGVLGSSRTVMGLMPHPERAADPLLGSTDGAPLFRSLVDALG